MVEAPQVRLLQLGADVLADQVDRDDVGLLAAPGDDDVGVLARGGDEGVEGRLDELCVLLDDAGNVAASAFLDR